jgi:hypothetical protein
MLILRVLVSVLSTTRQWDRLYFAQFVLRAFPTVDPVAQGYFEWLCTQLGEKERNQEEILQWMEKHIGRDGEGFLLALMELLIATHHLTPKMYEHEIACSVCSIITVTALQYDQETAKTGFPDNLRGRLRSYVHERIEALHLNERVRPALERYLHEQLS